MQNLNQYRVLYNVGTNCVSDRCIVWAETTADAEESFWASVGDKKAMLCPGQPMVSIARIMRVRG